jgi:hypothetical protein
LTFDSRSDDATYLGRNKLFLLVFHVLRNLPCAVQDKVCRHCELAGTPSHRMKAMLSGLIPCSPSYHRYELGYRFHNEILGSFDKIQISWLLSRSDIPGLREQQ